MANAKRYGFAIMTLQELEETKERMEKINELQEKRVQDTEAKAYQLANFYLVFQGVILAVVYQSPSEKCSYWWVPFVLSLLATIVNGFAFYQTMSKYMDTKQNHEANQKYTLALKLEIQQRRNPQARPPNNQNQNPQAGGFNNQHQMHREPMPDPVAWWLFRFYFWVVILALIIFAAFMLFACRKVPCKS